MFRIRNRWFVFLTLMAVTAVGSGCGTDLARLLGLSAVTAPVRELVLTQLDALHGSGAVAFNGTLYRLPT